MVRGRTWHDGRRDRWLRRHHIFGVLAAPVAASVGVYNFSDIPLWDMVFGTFRKARPPFKGIKADRRYDRYAKADTRFAPEGIYFMISHGYFQSVGELKISMANHEIDALRGKSRIGFCERKGWPRAFPWIGLPGQ
jgi:hypothetical protein